MALSKAFGTKAALVLGLAMLSLALTTPARADQSVIKIPGLHPSYKFEAEPHLLLVPFHDLEPGVGFRGTLVIVDNGFVRRINNSVGIGFGLDVSPSKVYLPVVMQWNFWLSRKWSVFGEPGPTLRLDKGKAKPDGSLYVGGRYLFTDDIALTLRVGYPAPSVGVSFLL